LLKIPEGKRQLGRSWCGFEDNIKIELKEISWEGVDWIGLAHVRHKWRAVVNTAMNIQIP
jgi:hypothetical protein